MFVYVVDEPLISTSSSSSSLLLSWVLSAVSSLLNFSYQLLIGIILSDVWFWISVKENIDEIFFITGGINFVQKKKNVISILRTIFSRSSTARSPKVWPPLMNSHSFMQTLTNQKSRTVSCWLLIGLNLYERMWINPKRSHSRTPCCNGSKIKICMNCSDCELAVDCRSILERTVWVKGELDSSK